MKFPCILMYGVFYSGIMLLPVLNRGLNWLEAQSYALRLGFVLVLLVAVAALDYLTGDELSFSLFYLLPLGAAAWLSRSQGIALSFLAAFCWWWVDGSTGHIYSSQGAELWNTAIRLGFFLIVSVLTASLRRVMLREQLYARRDPLTGALNSRNFRESLEAELERAKRYGHGFTLAYIDLDNFKKVNDKQGHARGDDVLKTIVAICQQQLRQVDTVARLGGDEFALLLPETTLQAADTTLHKVQAAVLAEMTRQNLPVTLSIGALSCQANLPDAEELVKLADALLYSVKRGDKNQVRLELLEGLEQKKLLSTTFSDVVSSPGVLS